MHATQKNTLPAAMNAMDAIFYTAVTLVANYDGGACHNANRYSATAIIACIPNHSPGGTTLASAVYRRPSRTWKAPPSAGAPGQKSQQSPSGCASYKGHATGPAASGTTTVRVDLDVSELMAIEPPRGFGRD
jgi:hypothetical protein